MARAKSARGTGEAVPDRADDFAKAFYALKLVFAKYAGQLHVNADTREKYYLETRAHSYRGKPLFFGAVIRGRAYVSFHLMPPYWEPSLQKAFLLIFKNVCSGKPASIFWRPIPPRFVN